MTLREILQGLECSQGSDKYETAWQELMNRIEFIEQLIEDGLNLDDEFVICYIWQGEPSDTAN